MKTLHIQLYVNRLGFDITPLILYAKAYNLKHGIDLQFNTVGVNVMGYKSSEFAEVRPGINYCVLLGAEQLVPHSDADIDIFMFDQSEWHTPPGSAYPLLPDTPTSVTRWNVDKPFISYGVYPPILGNYEIVLIHELMHAYNELAVHEGFNVTDMMDMLTLPDGTKQPYYLNDQPDNVNSNFINAWEQLHESGWLKD